MKCIDIRKTNFEFCKYQSLNHCIVNFMVPTYLFLDIGLHSASWFFESVIRKRDMKYFTAPPYSQRWTSRINQQTYFHPHRIPTTMGFVRSKRYVCAHFTSTPKYKHISMQPCKKFKTSLSLDLFTACKMLTTVVQMKRLRRRCGRKYSYELRLKDKNTDAHAPKTQKRNKHVFD